MNKEKILTIVVSILGLIGVFLFIRLLMASGDTAINSASGAIVSYGFYLFIIAVVVALIVAVINLIQHPKELKSVLLGVVVMGVILAVSYFTASDAAVTDSTGNILKGGEAGTVSKWVSTLITFTFILGVGSILAILFGFVKSLVK